MATATYTLTPGAITTTTTLSPLGKPGRIFGCRHCYLLAYEVQRDKDHERALRRRQALHERLRGFSGIAHGLPSRPKGMHLTTYEKLTSRWLQADMEMNFGAASYSKMGYCG
nr:hypothetical protein [Acidisarcina polymorpha]